MSKRILFITEGRNDEPRLMRRICELYEGFTDHSFVSYNTSLYELMRAIYVKDRTPKDCDLLGILKESRTTSNKSVLEYSYTDIYMLFDLDPHYHLYSEWKDKLPEMLEWFSESSLYGKLFINYPMMQSYQHIEDIDSNSFKNTYVEIDNFDGQDYKKMVKKTCDPRLKAPAHIKKKDMNRLLELNIMKVNQLHNRVWMVPDDLKDALNDCRILTEESSLMMNEGKMSVINTSVFCILHQNDYMFPKMLKHNSST